MEFPLPTDPERSVLAPDEVVIWRGGPDPNVTFAPQDAWIEVGAVVFLLLCITFVTLTIVGGAPVSFILLASAITLFAIYGAVGRFFYKRYDRRRTTYLVTNRRALVIRRSGADVRSVPSSQAPTLIERRVDGRHGTLRWGTKGPATSIADLLSSERGSERFAGTYYPAWSQETGVSFWDVPEFEELLAAMAQARTSPSDSG
ncbi:MAG: hypothetical protein ABSB09_16060 [Acidimicrobiales bacterium]